MWTLDDMSWRNSNSGCEVVCEVVLCMCLLPFFFYRRHQNKLFYLFIMSLKCDGDRVKNARSTRYFVCVRVCEGIDKQSIADQSHQVTWS